MNSAGSCDADPDQKTGRSDANRIGPHEGIKNKNITHSSQTDMTKNAKPNLLGQLLNKDRPKLSNYSSATVIATEAKSTTITNTN